MASNRYDVIVVGARCAGAPTTMLLARKGYRVEVYSRPHRAFAAWPTNDGLTMVIEAGRIRSSSRTRRISKDTSAR